jgi:hypothetical protein
MSFNVQYSLSMIVPLGCGVKFWQFYGFMALVMAGKPLNDSQRKVVLKDVNC